MNSSNPNGDNIPQSEKMLLKSTGTAANSNLLKHQELP